VHVIDNRMRDAAIWAFAGAVLSYIGLIHGAQLGLGVSPLVSLGYLMFAVTCVVLMRSAVPAPAAMPKEA
jgi:AGZA family xanthine/uracil permease-like MFS transporter